MRSRHHHLILKDIFHWHRCFNIHSSQQRYRRIHVDWTSRLISSSSTVVERKNKSSSDNLLQPPSSDAQRYMVEKKNTNTEACNRTSFKCFKNFLFSFMKSENIIRPVHNSFDNISKERALSNGEECADESLKNKVVREVLFPINSTSSSLERFTTSGLTNSSRTFNSSHRICS